MKNTKVKILLDKEVSYDDQKWVSIKLEKSSKPFIFIKNSKILKDGKVTTLFHKVSQDEDENYFNSDVMNRNFSRDFQLNDKSFRMVVRDAETKSGDKVLALVLETESKSQVVTYGHYFGGEYLGHLLWVGDLDNDGKLDFYMSFNDFEKGYFDSKLYLSSEAEKGKLVKEVAEFFTAGC